MEDAHLTAQLAVIEEMYGDLCALVRPLDAVCLNWTPPMPATNSIAAMIVHTVGSTHSWLSRALDEPYVRDRDAEFHARGDAESLLALLADSRERIRAQFARLTTVDPGTIRQVRRLHGADEEPLTVAWCIAHAVIHMGEHWGQMQLNRQLYAADRGQL